MTAIPKRAIDGEFAWLRGKDFQNLANHDRPVRAGGRFSGGDDLGDIVDITLRCVLFILVGEMPRILAWVSPPSLGYFGIHSVVFNWLSLTSMKFRIASLISSSFFHCSLYKVTE